MRSLRSNSISQTSAHVILPITGYTIREVRLRQNYLPTLIFQTEGQEEAKLDFEAVVLTLSLRGQEQVLRWDQKPYMAEQLMPLVELIGTTVKEANADKSGLLCIELSNKISLTARPEVWEGWHFSSARLTVHGDDGRLIIYPVSAH